jgi:DNA-binding SARP family transcriptional activator
LLITINLLSSFRLTYGSQPVPLQYRQVLLIEALWCAGGPVTADRLMRWLWSHPGRGARDTLRSHVSRTRRAAAAAGADPKQLIITGKLAEGRTMYQLADGLDIDAERFGQLAAAGSRAVRDSDYERGAEILARALSLWGNDPDEDWRPLAEAAHRPFARQRRLRLREMRKDAMLAISTAFVEQGRHREAVAGLEQVTHEYPDEGAALRLLAIALYKCERMGDAAGVCRRAIVSLRAAGHDDTPFQDLQRAILDRALPLRGAFAS